EFRRKIVANIDPQKTAVTLCTSTGCEALGAMGVLKALKEEFKKQGLEGKVDIKETGCLGFCEKGPRVVIYPEDIAYFKVQASDVPEIVSKTLLNKEIVDRLLYVDPNTGGKAKRLSDVPFYKYQYRLLM